MKKSINTFRMKQKKFELCIQPIKKYLIPLFEIIGNFNIFLKGFLFNIRMFYLWFGQFNHLRTVYTFLGKLSSKIFWWCFNEFKATTIYSKAIIFEVPLCNIAIFFHHINLLILKLNFLWL